MYSSDGQTAYRRLRPYGRWTPICRVFDKTGLLQRKLKRLGLCAKRERSTNKLCIECKEHTTNHKYEVHSYVKNSSTQG